MLHWAYGVNSYQVALIALAVAGVTILTSSFARGQSCTCRANGRDYEQGQMICMRGQLARCDMNLNNSSWKIVAETCPQTRLELPRINLAQLPAGQLPQSFPE